MYAEGFGFDSAYYWKMSAKEFSELLDASATIDIETYFQYRDTLEDIHPDCDILLMEHDRVEARVNTISSTKVYAYLDIKMFALLL